MNPGDTGYHGNAIRTGSRTEFPHGLYGDDRVDHFSEDLRLTS